jgi:predicted nucleic acid-binding protein
LLAVHAEAIDAPPLSSQVCSDRDDDKFIACALAGGVSVIVSGDKGLLAVDGYRGVAVLEPREFLTRYLERSGR